MRTLTPWFSGWHLLGAELRHWRLVRGLSQAELGALTHDSSALIAKVEKALRRPARDLVHRLDTALDAAGALEELWVAADRGDSAADAGFASGEVSAIASPTVARVREAEVESMLVMARAFADADHRSGGGHVRAAVDGYLAGSVRPILARDCPPHLRAGMLVAAARVLDVAGFTAFDCGDHEASRVRYRQALDLLEAAGAAASPGHVLTDLAMLAVHENEPATARDLAQAAAQASRSAGSHLGQARALAVLARAWAAAGEVDQAQRALGVAEEALHGADLAGEPEWVRFFTERQLAAEEIYALHRDVHPDRIAGLAVTVGTSRDGMHRRDLLVTLTLASCYLSEQRPEHRDPDRAAELLVQAVTGSGSLTSARTLAKIDRLRRGIHTYGSPATVRWVEDAVRAAAGV